MTFDSRSFIKPAVNSRHLYWASALSVEVVITLSTWLNQSNVLYRNFIGAVSFIVANWLFGCFENEQVLFIFMSALQFFTNISQRTIEIASRSLHAAWAEHPKNFLVVTLFPFTSS